MYEDKKIVGADLSKCLTESVNAPTCQEIATRAKNFFEEHGFKVSNFDQDKCNFDFSNGKVGGSIEVADDGISYTISTANGKTLDDDRIGTVEVDDIGTTVEDAVNQIFEFIDMMKIEEDDEDENISKNIKVGTKLFDNMTKENCIVINREDENFTVKYDNGDTQEFDSDYRFDVITESADDEDDDDHNVEIVFDINIAHIAREAIGDDPILSKKVTWTSSNAIEFNNDILDEVLDQLERFGVLDDQFTTEKAGIDESNNTEDVVVCKDEDVEFETSVPPWVRKVLSGLTEVSPYVFKATTEFAVDNVPDLTAWCHENGGHGCKTINDKSGRYIKIVDPLCAKLEKLGLMTLKEAKEDKEETKNLFMVCTNVNGDIAVQFVKENKEEAIKVCKYYNRNSKRHAGQFEVRNYNLTEKIFPEEEKTVIEGNDCKTRKFEFNVEWDDDGEGIEKKFTAEVCIPEDVYEKGVEAINDFLSDWLSDTYGFCHNGFSYDEIKECNEITESVKVGKSKKPLTESIENDNKFDWFLDYKGKDDIVLYADEREDTIETDRYPKHKEIEGQAAITRARKLLKDGFEGGIPVDKGKGSRAVHGFLRLGEDGKTLMIEIESNGSKNGTLVPLV